MQSNYLPRRGYYYVTWKHKTYIRDDYNSEQLLCLWELNLDKEQIRVMFFCILGYSSVLFQFSEFYCGTSGFTFPGLSVSEKHISWSFERSKIHAVFWRKHPSNYSPTFLRCINAAFLDESNSAVWVSCQERRHRSESHQNPLMTAKVFRSIR